MEGEIEVSHGIGKEKEIVKKMEAPAVFGEIALIYKTQR